MKRETLRFVFVVILIGLTGGLVWGVNTILPYEASSSCCIQPSREIEDLLVSRGLPEELLSKAPSEFMTFEADVFKTICDSCEDELCCLVEALLVERISEGFGVVEMVMGPMTWRMDQFGRFSYRFKDPA